MQAAAGGGGVTHSLSSLQIPIGIWSHHTHRIHKHIAQWKNVIVQQLVIENQMELKGRQYQMEKRIKKTSQLF